ncbi:hypothetical protein ACOME3_007521 [Neoechinorhynchus agilis]
MSHQILAIIEHMFHGTHSIKTGVLVELCKRMGFVSVIGLKYYPVHRNLNSNHDSRLVYAVCAYLWLDSIRWVHGSMSCQVKSSEKLIELIQAIKDFPFTFCLFSLTFLFTYKSLNLIRRSHEADSSERSSSYRYVQGILSNRKDRYKLIGHSAPALLILFVGIFVSIQIALTITQLDLYTGSLLRLKR